MPTTFKRILSIFLLIIIIFGIGTGYAVVSDDFELESDVTGVTQDEVFITDFYGSSSSGTVNNSSFIKSILTSDVTLNSTSSELTYTVQVYNNADEAYCYSGTLFDSTLGYSNENIDFKLSMVEGEWDTSNINTSVVGSKQYLTFTITFYHTGSGSNLSLESILNFKFIPLSKAQKVTLIYGDNSYMDVFSKSETVATFPDLHFDINATATANNVARCNRNAVATYNSSAKTISIKNVYSDYYNGNSSITVNNADNAVRCKIYNNLTTSLADTSFESSNYTINNFLIMSNVTDNGSCATIPTNKEWNVDINGKTVTYTGAELIKVSNASVLNFYNSGTINCNSNGILGEINHANAVVTLSDATYKFTPLWDAIKAKKGKIICRDATITNNGNVFILGLGPTAEANLSGASNAGSSYSMHIEAINCTITSTEANIFHSTSRQKIFCSLVNCKLSAGNTVILCNNGANQTEPAMAVWENVKFYVTGGTAYGGVQEFFSHGARIFYTESVSFTNGLTSTGTNALLNEGKANYFVLNYTSSTAEDWYYIKDTNGNVMTTQSGNKIKVGDKLEFISKKNTGLAIDIPSAKYAIGQKLQVYTDNNTTAQRWTFIIANSGYHLSTYKKPTFFVFTHYATLHTDLRNVATLDSGSNSYWRTWSGARFTVEKQSETGMYMLISGQVASAYNSSWTGNLVLYAINNGTLSSGAQLGSSYKNNDPAKMWYINNG